jgi:hypothetical protein
MEWDQIGGPGAGVYETTDAFGEVWRLELAEGGAWLLFAKGRPRQFTPIPGDRGIFHVIDVASWLVQRS